MHKRKRIRFLFPLLLLIPNVSAYVRASLMKFSSLFPFPVIGLLLAYLLFRFRPRHVLIVFEIFLLLWLPLYHVNEPQRNISQESLIKLARTLLDEAERYRNAKVLTFDEVVDVCMDLSSLRVKFSRFPEWMRRTHTAGIFVPITGEAIINPLEPAFTLPFIALHEISHANGDMNEGRANISAYRFCTESDHPSLRYAASIYALHYTLLRLRALSPKEVCVFRNSASTRVYSDLARLGTWNKESPCTRAFLPFAGDYANIVPELIEIFGYS